MIELTTGVIFLMSSLYGGGHADNHVDTISAQSSVEQATSTENIDILTSDPKAMEAFLRREYADDPLLVDIARCESSFHQFDSKGNIVRGRVNSADVGVMQINEKYHGEMAKKLGFDLYTVEGNIAYAKHLYNEQGSQPWISSSKCWGSNSIAKN